MGHPTAEEISRSLQDLQLAARGWQVAGDRLADRSAVYAGPIANGMAFGLFSILGAVYQQTCLSMSDAARVGGSRIEDVGHTLSLVCRAYQEDEERNVHLAQGSW